MQDARIKDTRLAGIRSKTGYHINRLSDRFCHVNRLFANRDSVDSKKRFIDTWVSLPQNTIDEAVDQWHQHGCAHV